MKSSAEPSGRKRSIPRPARAETPIAFRETGETPIRAELFTVEQLARHAGSMARWQPALTIPLQDDHQEHEVEIDLV